MKLKPIVQALAALSLISPALAQQVAEQKVEITGSSIKRLASEGALPVQVITRQDIERQGIISAEQLILSLTANGNGLDNLASNADVVAGAARGMNGLSAANLRNQGAASTLVLLNGRRVAAHGLNGGIVDLNSIPMAAIERVEVLKDGASSLYGTDAVGGVINFILRRDFRGLEGQVFSDTTQAGGGNLKRARLVGGTGNLDKDGYNLLASIAVSDVQALRGDQRSFVNTFQPDRGLSVDTRGTPFATVFAISSLYNALSRDNLNTTGRGTGPTLPGNPLAYNGINVLDLPGMPGCNSIDGMAAYDEKLWATPNAAFGCAWDTGRAAVLQQPVRTTNAVLRGTVRAKDHLLNAEAVFGRADSAKSFSPNQLSSSTSTTSPLYNLAYPSTGAGYNYVFDALAKAFPQLASNRGLPLAFRWRCMPCGNREIETNADTSRFLVSAEGPLFAGWDYRAGISTASSDTVSTLGGGYHYGKELAALINTGVLNPFLQPGQSQTPQALAALDAISARGVNLYGGKMTLRQVDAVTSGPVFKAPGGEAMAAVGVDIRKERYQFNGNETDLATQARIFNAPFDSVNTLAPVERDIKAVYSELMVPLHKRMEVTLSARRDDYTGFGTTTNPKASFRLSPADNLVLRGSNSSGFRVPTFNQLYFGVTESPYSGKDLVDPFKCVGGKVDAAKPECTAITPLILTGGKPDLGPEKSRSWTVGAVWEPVRNYTLGADLWQIRREGTIQSLGLTTIVANYTLFPDNFIRDAAGNIAKIDQRWVNAGETITRGLDLSARANGTMGPGRWTLLAEGTRLMDKRSRLIASAPFSDSEVGVFTRAGDLGLRWKHNIVASWTQNVWTTTVVQRYRAGYKDFVLPGVANGSIVPPNFNPDVAAYQLWDMSVRYTGVKNMGLTVGVKNLFDRNPPFSSTYDSNTGAGSSWEPRVADPRGRAFTITLDYKFL
ncbi:MAG: TonB-dependent receptor [Burkholderiales bacterium]|nr:TonB-dependent receptor [Burkholderiales bacterium]NBO76273.1 TonB-dependent receptor [Betaproteobacteria bacterium]